MNEELQWLAADNYFPVDKRIEAIAELGESGQYQDIIDDILRDKNSPNIIISYILDNGYGSMETMAEFAADTSQGWLIRLNAVKAIANDKVSIGCFASILSNTYDKNSASLCHYFFDKVDLRYKVQTLAAIEEPSSNCIGTVFAMVNSCTPAECQYLAEKAISPSIRHYAELSLQV